MNLTQPSAPLSQPATTPVGSPLSIPPTTPGTPLTWSVPVWPISGKQPGIPILFPVPQVNIGSVGATPLTGGTPFVPGTLQGRPDLQLALQELLIALARYGTWGLTGVGALAALSPAARAVLGLTEAAAGRVAALGALGELLVGLPQLVPTPGAVPQAVPSQGVPTPLPGSIPLR